MATKYNIADMVRLGSVEDIERCVHGFNGEMLSLAGQVATITESDDYGYRIDLDDGNWFWCDNCISNEYFGEPTVVLDVDTLL